MTGTMLKFKIMTKLAEKAVAEKTLEVKATSAKAGKESASDKFNNAAVMEGKQERVKSELAKAYDRAEAKAVELFREKHLAEVQTMIEGCICEALAVERDKFAAREEKEAKVIEQILTKGREESDGFKIRFSDTENGMTETAAEDIHTMFAAAKQSMLKVKIAEREEKAAAAAAEEERKQKVMEEVGVTPEMLAALKAAGVIK